MSNFGQLKAISKFGYHYSFYDDIDIWTSGISSVDYTVQTLKFVVRKFGQYHISCQQLEKRNGFSCKNKTNCKFVA